MLKNYLSARKLYLFSVIVLNAPIAFAQMNNVDLGSNNHAWYLKAQAEAGNKVSDLAASNQGWTPAVVPGTVFNSFVVAGVEKDPNFGDNIQKVDRNKYDRSFWYRTEFTVPASYANKRVWLNFNGINRRGKIYLNGEELGKLDGFMNRGRFDITGKVKRNSENTLAVLVSIPAKPLSNFGSPEYMASGGWDWMPYVPGLNSGITDKVYLSSSNDLTLVDPWVRTALPTNARADVSIALQIKNNSAKDKDGILKGTIMPGNIQFTKKVHVDAGTAKDFKLTKQDYGQLMISNPKLWWPNGYGEPNLYDLKLSLILNDSVSDEQHIKFGIKRYSYDTVGHVLHLAINGVPVFIKGGNWGMSEYMLRCRGDEYDTKLRFHKEMNLNMIRNWIGHTTDDEFYQACDKYGIMVWDDFWLNSNPNLPEDVNVFNANAVEKIKRVRNHPSVAIWCGDNEGWPEPPISNWLKEDIQTFDGNDRYYQANSHADNLTGSGPWAAKDQRYYFLPFPQGIGGNKGWGFRSEMGTAVFVNLESFKKFMPADKLWPRNEMWNQHYFGDGASNAGPDQYDKFVAAFGKPQGIEDYTRKAQFVNIESNKAMYEGWLDHIGEDASGIMDWMTQSAYPSMIWQTYDYYYDLTGAYFGVKKACEPLHMQWNPVTNAIKVVNTTRAEADNLTATAEVYNLDGKLVKQYSKSAQVTSIPYSAVEAFKLGLLISREDLAQGKKATASSSYGDIDKAFDGDHDTRWSSHGGDEEWICVDLGKSQMINGVHFNWQQEAFGKAFKLLTSEDNEHWHEVYRNDDGKPGVQTIEFPEIMARYVKMQGIRQDTWQGFSLYDFEVYPGNVPSPGLTDVHFIKLKLTDKTGQIVSENTYWRGNNRTDYSALNTLKKVNLKLQYNTRKADGKTYIIAKISNPASSQSAAFGVRLRLTKTSTGEQILPAIMSDNYFSLMAGETHTVQIEFNDKDLGSGGFQLMVDPFNDHVVK